MAAGHGLDPRLRNIAVPRREKVRLNLIAPGKAEEFEPRVTLLLSIRREGRNREHLFKIGPIVEAPLRQRRAD